MEPYGGIGTGNLLNMSVDQIVDMLGKSGSDFFDGLSGRLKAQADQRQIELTGLAQDIHHTFATEHGARVLMWMIEKTLLNPALPLGVSFEQSGPWRAGREAENAFVFQLVLAMHHYRMANGGL